jgi:uncharacterized membrane protein YuzA (DUF378 family)
VLIVWLFDFPSLILIIAAGLQAGLQAIFGVDAAGSLLGAHAKVIFVLMGLSAVWQIFRQKFH